jgi:hypothetical protein
MLSVTPLWTACLASKRVVQRDSPLGGGPHASATSAACCVLSSFDGFGGRGSSLNACSSPLAW